MSADDVIFSLESFRHRLAEGAYMPFVEAVSKGLTNCPVALLPGIIESRLQENPQFLKPKHEPGSAAAIAEEYQQTNRGGLFGPSNPNAKLAPMPAPIDHFPTLGEQLSPSSDLSVAQRMELLARGKIRGDERPNTTGHFVPTSPHLEWKLPAGQESASNRGSLFGRQDPVK
jgi:hypothetical protein